MPAFFQNMVYDSVGLTELDIPHIYTVLITITSIFLSKRGTRPQGRLVSRSSACCKQFQRGKADSSTRAAIRKSSHDTVVVTAVPISCVVG